MLKKIFFYLNFSHFQLSLPVQGGPTPWIDQKWLKHSFLNKKISKRISRYLAIQWLFQIYFSCRGGGGQTLSSIIHSNLLFWAPAPGQPPNWLLSPTVCIFHIFFSIHSFFVPILLGWELFSFLVLKEGRIIGSCIRISFSCDISSGIDPWK